MIPIFKFRFSYISLFSSGFIFYVCVVLVVRRLCGKFICVQKKVVFMEMSLGNVASYCLDYLEFYTCKVLYNPISSHSDK